MEKTIVCAECNVNYAYTPNPDYPDKRKYCALCSAKKQEQWEKKDEPKEIPPKAVAMTGMPISEQRIIVRQCCIKAASTIALKKDEVLELAEHFEKWVFR